MGSIFHGWKGRWVRGGLGMALLGLSIGCTNNGTNTLPSKNQLPPPKPFHYSGVEPINSPAYKNLQGNNQQPGGANFNTFPSNNNTTTLPTTRISAPESARPDARSAMNPQIGIPTNPVGNPASFGGPSGNSTPPRNPIQPVGYNAPTGVNPIQPVGYNTPTGGNPPVTQPSPQMQPLQQMQPLPQSPTPPPTSPRLPAVNSVPPNGNANAPAWPNPNANQNPPLNNPANWNEPATPNSGGFNPAPTNGGSNLNPIPPAPPVGFNNPGPSNGLQPLKLPESISAKPSNNTAIQPVGAVVPPLGTLDPVPDNTPAPILAPATRVISTFPPQSQRRENVPPVVIGSDDIPAAPVIPQR